MLTILLWIVVAIVVFAVVMQIIQLRRNVTIDLPQIWAAFDSVKQSQQALERAVKDDLAKSREDAAAAARQAREEQAKTLGELRDGLQQSFAGLQKGIEQRLQSAQTENAAALTKVREEADAGAKQLRADVAASLKGFQEALVKQTGELGQAQKTQLAALAAQLEKLAGTTDEKLTALNGTVDARLKASQEAGAKTHDQLGNALGEQVQAAEKRLAASIQQLGERIGQLSSQRQG